MCLMRLWTYNSDWLVHVQCIYVCMMRLWTYNYTLTCTCTLYLGVYDEAMNWELTLSGRFLESSLLDIGEIHRRWITSLLRVSSWVTCPSPGTYLSPVTQHNNTIHIVHTVSTVQQQGQSNLQQWFERKSFQLIGSD